MTAKELRDIIATHPQIGAIRELLQVGSSKAEGSKVLLRGLHAGMVPAVLSLIPRADEVLVVEAADIEQAMYLASDMRTMGAEALLFPTSTRRHGVPDEALEVQRTEVLARLGSFFANDTLGTVPPCHPLRYATLSEGQSPLMSFVITTYAEALEEAVPAREEMTQNSLQFARGQQVNLSEVEARLTDMGFERVDFVYQPGQWAHRGGIVDIYSFSHDDPYRLDLFGNEIDSLRTFDIESQLSKERIESCTIVGPVLNDISGTVPAVVGKSTHQGLSPMKSFKTATLFDYIEKGIVATLDLDGIEVVSNDPTGTVPAVVGKSTHQGLSPIGSLAKSAPIVSFDTVPQPTFAKNFELLEQDLREKIADGYTIYIAADQKKQLDRLRSIFEQGASGDTLARSNDTLSNDTLGTVPTCHPLRSATLSGGQSPLTSLAKSAPLMSPIRFTDIEQTIHEGFVDKEKKIAVYTDHQIFERYHRIAQSSDNARRGKAIITLREINQLQVGDYVVHSDHGIGQFGGLVKTEVNGRPQEMIRINYRGGGYIFVSIHNLNRISKYKGKEGVPPTVSSLGSGAWERLKERTKDKVKDIARELIQLYAKRKQQPGFRYAPDGYMQHELEASFLYEDTPDQAKATADVKRDMESGRPMDRLICGDVGFGKTEVAIRAAFKAAADGKQVAVLVPTTVLALQHFATFRDRLKDYPVTIEFLSRSKSPKETKEILDKLAEGKIDILIGTHKLVGKSVKWHDLGLLIIDEEQKFGVAVKERIKSLRANVDVLTLTATPIPRTLQFSLLGARDLSVISTPPPNRYPVQTEIIGNEETDVIREAIVQEMSRNGQVFVVNNNIDMLPRVADRLQRLVPEARIVIAHGQMKPEDMEERLEAFINYDYDILVSTTIIESGIDIPNVNTMIIYSAQHYGLSDLHQLRGRVGRSNRKAYCYLVTPDRKLLTADARRRLEAVETFSDLGSGFNLAMQDLDIRGAGNMLGSEQSGFIAELGYDTYQKILNEAVTELKEELNIEDCDPSGTVPAVVGKSTRQGLSPLGSQHEWVKDCLVETDLNLCLPSSYVENISERIALYRELDTIQSEQALSAFEQRLTDRFGAMPDEARELMQVVRLRRLCCQLGIEKIFLKGEKITLFLPSVRNTAYYHSDTYTHVLHYIQTRGEKRSHYHVEHDKKTNMERHYITIDSVRTIEGAINLLSKIEN